MTAPAADYQEGCAVASMANQDHNLPLMPIRKEIETVLSHGHHMRDEWGGGAWKSSFITSHPPNLFGLYLPPTPHQPTSLLHLPPKMFQKILEYSRDLN